MINYRNYAGMECAKGKLTCFLHRSASVKFYSDYDLEMLKKKGIDTIIDLRIIDKLQEEKLQWRFKNFKYLNYGLYIDTNNYSGEKNEIEFMHNQYMQLLEQKQVIYGIFEKISNIEGNVIICCSLGKDRTGIIVALLLMLCEVKKQDIVKDYILSEEEIKQVIKENKVRYRSPSFTLVADANYMSGFIQKFEDKYCNIVEYLKHVGINEMSMARIRGKMIDTKNT